MLANTELTALGWIFMLLSTLAVTGLTCWCFKKVLGDGDEEPPESHIGLGP